MSKPISKEERREQVLEILAARRERIRTPNDGVIEKFEDFVAANKQLLGKTLGDIFDADLNQAAREVAFNEK